MRVYLLQLPSSLQCQMMENEYCNVFCFILISRGLVIEDNNLSENILIRGLWSVTTVNLGHPRRKFLALCKHQAIAKASPSIGAYRFSAS